MQAKKAVTAHGAVELGLEAEPGAGRKATPIGKTRLAVRVRERRWNGLGRERGKSLGRRLVCGRKEKRKGKEIGLGW